MSSPSKTDNRADLLSLGARLLVPHDRSEAARAIARLLGAEELIMLVLDEEVGALLPAPGFPQTLAGLDTWRTFMEATARGRTHCDQLTTHAGTLPQPAVGIAAADGSQAVLLGGSPSPDGLEQLRLVLPLLAAGLRAEAAARNSGAEVALARGAAAQAEALAAALDRERTYIESVHQLGLTIAAETDLHVVLQVVTDAATRLCNAQIGAFFYYVLDEGDERYTLYTLSGAPRSAFADFPMPRNTLVFSPTFRGEGVVRSDDITQDARYGRNPPHNGMPVGHPPVRSYLAAPVSSAGGEVLGGLFFGHSQPGVFSDHDERLARGVAAQAAVAIENARLHSAEQTARRSAEAALRARDEFLSIAAHELRTPITAIKASAELALRAGRRGSLDLDRAERTLRTVVAASNRLTVLTDDLLDVARLETGQMVLRPVSIELATVVRDVVRRYAEVPQTAIEFEIEAPEAPVQVNADPIRIEQVLDNLLSNAVKYSPAGGVVELRLSATADGAQLTVRDTGIGLPPGAEQSIFAPFGRARNAADSHVQGMGLGLHICRRIIEQHGGRVWAESDGEGRGTTFAVWLPLLAASATRAIQPHASEGTAGDGERAR